MTKSRPTEEQEDLVSIIVPTRGIKELLAPCLESLNKNTSYTNYELIIVDDSGDGHLDLSEFTKQFKVGRIVKNGKNMGFAATVNNGIMAARGKYFFIMNDDFLFQNENWLSSDVRLAKSDDKIGIVGWKLLFPDGRIQTIGETANYKHIGHKITGEQDNGQYNSVMQVDYTNGLIKRELTDKIGLFDEGFYPAYYEDADLGFRAKKIGYKAVYNPTCVITHFKSATIERVRDEKFNYYLAKNELRFILLNFPISWILLRILYSISKAFQKLISRRHLSKVKNSKEGIMTGTPRRMRSESYARAILTNLKLMRSIAFLRRHRSRKLVIQEMRGKYEGFW